jgi:predicted amidohydrolase YtcJ
VDTATALVRKAIPAATAAQTDEALAKAQEQLLSVGVTGVGSMSTSVADWQAFRRAGESGQLKVRLMAYMLGTESMSAVPHPTGWLYADHLRAVGIKFFADGALGSRGAWLKQPYADKPDTRGLQFHSDAELLSLTNRAAAAGFQIATHAIGDAANAQVIGRTSSYRASTAATGAGASSISRSSIPPTFRASRRRGSLRRCNRPTRRAIA